MVSEDSPLPKPQQTSGLANGQAEDDPFKPKKTLANSPPSSPKILVRITTLICFPSMLKKNNEVTDVALWEKGKRREGFPHMELMMWCSFCGRTTTQLQREKLCRRRTTRTKMKLRKRQSSSPRSKFLQICVFTNNGI